ncbi:PAAR domain-containing protein [Embleya sp. AB8]|uniref:PAAR domain-containing protein n=1 Tax=Embleya sp. AB8 TaxID=3156304 RepID=UPI003C7599C3
MPPAARTGDATEHGGLLGTPPPGAAVAVATVLIGARPAAVTGSLHVCPAHPELGPANVVLPSPGAVAAGVVLIGGLPAARVGDNTACGAKVVLGAPNVLIGGLL